MSSRTEVAVTPSLKEKEERTFSISGNPTCF